jgi:hypothetical protein
MRKVRVGLGISVGALAAVVAWSCGQATPPGSQPGKAPAPPAMVLPVTVVLACDKPDTLSDKGPEGITVLKVAEANEGTPIRYLDSPDGWQNACGMEARDDPDKIAGRATYNFQVSRDDTFYIALRAKWLVRIDSGRWFNLEDQNGYIGDKNYKWAWHQLFVGGRPKGFDLKAGSHTFMLNIREDGPKFNQVVISSDASPPVGDGAVAESSKQ